MLEKLRIQNFKGWKDTGDIQLAPITLFFGTNSSGKSSIGHFLMMLKQTVESPDRKAVFYTGGKNSAVQLGALQNIIYQHKKDNDILFDYPWSLPVNMAFRDLISKKQFSGNALKFSARIGMDRKESQIPMVKRFNYSLLKDNEDVMSISLAQNSAKKNSYIVTATHYTLRRNKGRAWEIKNPVRFYGFPEEVSAYYQNADFVQNMNLEQENLFRSIMYLGPLRTKAERIYSWSGTEPEHVGYSGENAVAALLSAKDRVINLDYKGKYRPLSENIASSLKKMQLIDDFTVNKISEDRQDYEVKVVAKGSSEPVDIPDVGVGVSQVLPVLVQCFYAPANSIIIMEQPEIHLHPAAQADLADVMIDVIKSREGGEDRNIQLIIETHSEHFLRRLQRRIAEGVITKDKVVSYFADNAVLPAKLTALDVDEFGNIKNWPKNFFGDEMGDIAAQARAVLEKRKSMRGKNAY